MSRPRIDVYASTCVSWRGSGLLTVTPKRTLGSHVFQKPTTEVLHRWGSSTQGDLSSVGRLNDRLYLITLVGVRTTRLQTQSSWGRFMVIHTMRIFIVRLHSYSTGSGFTKPVIARLETNRHSGSTAPSYWLMDSCSVARVDTSMSSTTNIPPNAVSSPRFAQSVKPATRTSRVFLRH